jgi:hypothetical protein
MSPQHPATKVVLVGMLGFSSCEGNSAYDTPPPDSTGGQEETPDTARDLERTQEEREILEYCEKVREISDKQQETDRKLEEILTHIEGLNKPPLAVSLSVDKKRELLEGWITIEAQKKSSLQEIQLKSGTPVETE